MTRAARRTASTVLGYEERRDELEAFVDKHYLETFRLEPTRMLDAGCGDGFWSDIFARRGFRVHGVDLDSAAIAAARRRATAAAADGAYPPGCQPSFDIGDVLKPTTIAGLEPRGAYGLIFARTLPHFYQPKLDAGTRLVEQLLEQLHPNGRILLSIYTHQSEQRERDGAVHHHQAFIVRAVIEAGADVRATRYRDEYFQVLAAHPTTEAPA